MYLRLLTSSGTHTYTKDVAHSQRLRPLLDKTHDQLWKKASLFLQPYCGKCVLHGPQLSPRSPRAVEKRTQFDESLRRYVI